MSFKKQIAIFIIATLVIVGAVFSTQTNQTPAAQAFSPGVVAVNTAKWVWERVTKALDWANEQTKVNLFNSALRTYLNNVAYESASYIAAGGPGGSPLLDVRVPNRIFDDAANAALGDAIGRISETHFEDLGINLCDPSADVKARITLGIIDDQAPPKPRCDVRQVQEQWRQFGQSLTSGQWLSQAYIGLNSDQKAGFLSGYFDPSQNDLGAFLKLQEYAFEKQLLAIETEKLTAEICQGYFSDRTPVTEEVITHCRDVEGVNIAKNQLILQEAQLSSSETVFINAAKLFGNTLYSKFLKNIIGGGYSFSNIYKFFDDDSQNVRDSLIDRLRGNVDLRRGATPTDFLADIQTVNVTRIDDYQYLDELGSCPQDRSIASQNNCTIDQQFLTAISNRETVAEAIDQGHLNPNLPLISYLNASLNGDKNCFQNGYCYSNIAKLRKFRVLPVGWEIAAALSPVDRPITLGEAIGCFDNKDCVLEASQNVFFRLIDPNWVLGAPLAQCKALVNGPSLQDVLTDQRQQVCVDHPSCLSEDGQGNCIGGYGYCTQEQSIWRFDGRQCLEQYASCGVFIDNESGGRFTYLRDTIDFCDPSQGGCLWYSKSKTNVGTAAEPFFDYNINDKIYLNNRAGECPSSAAGCTQFIVPDQGGVNLITNGNFDIYELNPSTNYNDPEWLNDNLSDQFPGWVDNGVNFNLYTTRDEAYIGLTGLRMSGNGQLSTQANAGLLTDQTVTFSFYAKADNECVVNASIGSISTPAVSVPAQINREWQRFRLTHTFGPNNIDLIATAFIESNSACGNMYVDGVKLEIGDGASSFTPYGEQGYTHLNGQRVSCSQDEIGCSVYTPLNGDPIVPGIISQNDVCPAECVGYNTFLGLPTVFDELEGNTDATFQDFVPSTANACSAAEVGCSEFTNLDEVAQGGEGKYYYSFVRQCVDDSLGITYYTLEGSDTTGFQVRTWLLLQTNLGNGEAPCSNVNPGDNTCADTGATVGLATCSGLSLATDPDCRTFYDLNGNSWPMRQSKVIFASDDCHPLRRTTTGVVYNGVDSESRSCSQSNVGCREYRGNQGNNLRTALFSDFEGGNYEPWSGAGISLSNEAVAQGGHSMKVSNVNSFNIHTDINDVVQEGREYYLSFWMKNDNPVNVTWAMGVSTDSANCPSQGLAFDQCLFEMISVPVASDWQLYEVGPLLLENVTNPNNVLELNVNSSIFLDNITLKEASSNVFVVENSWNTPVSCDQPFQGAMLGCQQYQGQNGQIYNLKSFSQVCREEAIGCQAVINTYNSDSPFQQTWHDGDPSEVRVPADQVEFVVINDNVKCPASYQGCTELGKPNLNRDLPDFDPDYVESWSTQYKIVDPDNFDDILCTEDGLFCREYNNNDGASVYFKDPGDRTCSYREGVNINGVLFSGWFQTDSLEPGVTPIGCYSDQIPPFVDDDFRIREAIEGDYAGWVATCPASQNRCEEFVDTQSSDGDNLLQNADFAEVTGSWVATSAYGNTASIIYAPNPTAGEAKLLVSPHGYTLAKQTFTPADSGITNADIYTLTGEVKINNWEFDQNNNGAATIEIRCHWDSPFDTDYCSRITDTIPPINYESVEHDLTQPCETDLDCGGSYPICYKTASAYCGNPTTGQRSNDVCNKNGFGGTCQELYGYGPDWSCNSVPGDYTSDGVRRDHFKDYKVSADLDPEKWGTWQTLNVTTNIGAASQGDELTYCYAGATIFNHYISPTYTWPNPPSGTLDVDIRNLNFREAKSYYYFDDEQVDDGDCSGRVSEKAGCVLFDDVSNPAKTFNSFLTYRESLKIDGGFVSPVVCDPNSSNPEYRNCTNDANRIIKVRPDRQCQEWLSCRSTTQIFDPQTNSYRQICNEIGLCSEYSANGDILNCKNWVEGDAAKLDYNKYVSRDITFNGTEYSGYSLYNKFPVDDLVFVNINPADTTPDYRLAYRLGDIDYTEVNFDDACDAAGLNDDGIGVVKGDDPGYCVVGIDGSRFDSNSPFVIDETARGYAEDDSPFPSSIIGGGEGDQRSLKFGFQEANVCEPSIASCEEGYFKMQYGAGGTTINYHAINGPLGGDAVPTCICQGGTLDGQACNNFESPQDEDNIITAEDRCPQGGNPAILRRSESYLNWPGYCLEEDFSRNINGSSSEYACLTWLPVDAGPAGIDYFSQNREAGYSYKSPAFYCAEFGLKEDREYWQTPCMDSTNDIYKEFKYLNENGTEGSNVQQNTIDDHTTYIDNGNYIGFDGRKCGGNFLSGHDHFIEVYPIVGVNGCQGEIIGYVKGNPITKKCVADYDGSTFAARNTKRGGDFKPESEPYSACSYLAETVTARGDNAAITNLFWSRYRLNGYQVNLNDDSTGDIDITRDDTPFGSAAPGTGFRADDFPLLPTAAKGTVPRAGTPYSCNANQDICSDLTDRESPLYIDGWLDPRYLGKEENDNYVKGLQRIRQIYQRIFGVYRFEKGATCDFNICNADSGILGGLECQTDSDCQIRDTNTCQLVESTCLNSAFGAIPCQACPQGFSPGYGGRCVSDWTNTFGSLGCSIQCQTVSIPPETSGDNYLCYSGDDGIGSAVGLGSDEWKCISDPIGASSCQVQINSSTFTTNLSCRNFGTFNRRCFDDITNKFLNVACQTDSDCSATFTTIDDFEDLRFTNGAWSRGTFNQSGIVSFLNSVAVCGQIDQRYCVGPDFNIDPGTNAYFSDFQDCNVNQYNLLNGIFRGYYNDDEGLGNEICQQEQLGRCVPSTSVLVAETGPVYVEDRNNDGDEDDLVPYCRLTVDTYQPLCDPDTDPNCESTQPGIQNCDPADAGCDDDAIPEDALPLDGRMTQLQAEALARSNVSDNQGDVIQARDSNFPATGLPRYSGAARSPFIAATECDPSTGTCAQGGFGLFTVNGTTTIDIIGETSNTLVNISFYMSAFKDHLPIRYIDIDWGDDSFLKTLGYYKNALPICSPDYDTQAPNWPGVNPVTSVNYSVLESAGEPNACEETPKQYFHLYTYDENFDCGDGTDYACYTPKITIQDNWGWCTNNTWAEIGVECSGGAIEFPYEIRVPAPTE